MQKKLEKYIIFQQYLDKVLERAEEVQCDSLPAHVVPGPTNQYLPFDYLSIHPFFKAYIPFILNLSHHYCIIILDQCQPSGWWGGYKYI